MEVGSAQPAKGHPDASLAGSGIDLLGCDRLDSAFADVRCTPHWVLTFLRGQKPRLITVRNSIMLHMTQMIVNEVDQMKDIDVSNH
jgi:hypothetical protein